MDLIRKTAIQSLIYALGGYLLGWVLINVFRAIGVLFLFAMILVPAMWIYAAIFSLMGLWYRREIVINLITTGLSVGGLIFIVFSIAK